MILIKGVCSKAGPAHYQAQWETPADVVAKCPTCGADMTLAVTVVEQGKVQTLPEPVDVLLAKLKAKAKPAKLKAKSKALIADKYPELDPGTFALPTYPTTTLPAQTQKAKGILTLQSAGVLDESMAHVSKGLGESVIGVAVLGGYPVFARPCPITPRHGFVDSRVVKSEDELAQVWLEALAADPQAEMVLMPWIPATHSMVWRPGLLSVGPGHDGATAGHDSITITLEPGYSKFWKGLAVQAGCNLETSTPFLEAVASDKLPSVVTQIRAGDNKPAPTEPNWNPYPGMIIGGVVPIDPAHKSDPGAMLAWETNAKTLCPGVHVVWNPGGNLGDHWSVHARLAGISVITTFMPVTGQTLPAMGELPVPLNPQAIVWGYLGGLIAPSLLPDVARQRAVACALLGSHHGLRMGGEMGVHLGASVAVMLRLAQAACWGECRHKDGGKGVPLPKGQPHVGKLSRQQVFAGILDNWAVGRLGMLDKGKLFLQGNWSGGYGGPAWAACAGATNDLDATMLTLMANPTEQGAKQVVATLTNVVNLAHNNGWWLNKFTKSDDMYNLAAALDPRVAILAGPIWYEATKANHAHRLQLLDWISHLSMVDLNPFGLQKALAHAKVMTANVSKGHKGLASGILGATKGDGGVGGEVGYPSHPYAGKSKLTDIDTVAVGGIIASPMATPPLAWQWRLTLGKDGAHYLRYQLLVSESSYVSGMIGPVDYAVIYAALTKSGPGVPYGPSYVGSSTVYQHGVIGFDPSSPAQLNLLGSGEKVTMAYVSLEKGV